MKSWCIGQPSARFVAKMEDVLAVYAQPYDAKRPVVCLDEVSKTLHSTPRGTISMRAGAPARQDYEYERHGAASLFLSIEPLGGKRKLRVRERRTAIDHAEIIREIVDIDYPDADIIVLVEDNLNTHGPAALYAAFAPAEARRIAERIEWHYTPEHGSWLNIAECELSVLERQCLNRRIPDIDTLTREALAWEQDRNRKQVGVEWHFTNADARIKLRRLYPVVKVQ